MTPQDRRQRIIQRQIDGGFSDHDIVSESHYQGYWYYKGGTNATDKKISDVEQALDRLEDKKE